MRPLTRVQPQGPVQAYKTYAIDAPKGTHWQDASCSDVDCQVQASGWVTLVDETTDLGQRQAHYIRRLSGRRFVEQRAEAGTEFVFPAGEECFQAHRIRVDRPELFVVRGGDHRGNPRREQRIHDRPEDWVEDFSEHQDAIRTRLERG